MVLALVTLASAATVQDIVGQVSVDSYRDFLDNHLYTHAGNARGFGTSGNPRYPAAEHDAARDSILSEFVALGLSTTLDPFTFTKSGTTYMGANNVVAVKLGEDRPGDIYILGAHYDSVENPGADDDASGVAAILEAARVLSSYEFEATLVFIAFDAEEKGLYGSMHYAGGATGQIIRGMVSLDMIAYNPLGEHHDKVNVYGRTASAPIKQALADAVTAYSGGILREIGGDVPYSDHAPFEAQGFQACLLIEHAWGANGKYHRLTDSVDTAGYIDYTYATAMTRSAVGYAATAAGLVPEPATMLMLTLGMLALIARRAPGKRGGQM